MVSAPYRSYVLVSREQIARNYRAVRAVVGPSVEVAAVVKADAYGHGALEVSRVVTAEGAKWLAVSSVEEGITLRRSGIAARILVMGGFLPHEAEALTEFDLTPAVHSLEQIAQVDRHSESTGKTTRYHLKIDSGMGRLGTREMCIRDRCCRVGWRPRRYPPGWRPFRPPKRRISRRLPFAAPAA